MYLGSLISADLWLSFEEYHVVSLGEGRVLALAPEESPTADISAF